MNLLARMLTNAGLIRHITRMARPLYRQIGMLYPTFDPRLHGEMFLYRDYIRYVTIGLALRRIEAEGTPGALAELGVYRGELSRFIRAILPERTFYLFDTFEGFAPADQAGTAEDRRFRDTSVERVLARVGDVSRVVVRKGEVPGTLRGLEGERFAFVLLDMDKHRPTAASLEFFYPLLSPGGYLLVHDYNSPESDGACARALDGFLRGKPEKLIEAADRYGSALFRKI
ncbi:MAG: TylF/MycF/NovP-related O-methyltransferase [Bacteroidota bacterium]